MLTRMNKKLILLSLVAVIALFLIGRKVRESSMMTMPIVSADTDGADTKTDSYDDGPQATDGTTNATAQPQPTTADLPPHSSVPATDPKQAASTPELSAEDLAKIRSDAKSHLASSYSAQASFKAEFARYTSDLKVTGWKPGDPEVDFKMGFLEPYNAKTSESTGPDLQESPMRMTTDAFVGSEADDSNQKLHYTKAAEKIRLRDYSKYCRNRCTASEDDFEMLLVRPLDDQGHNDVWLLNARKEMTLVQDGRSP